MVVSAYSSKKTLKLPFDTTKNLENIKKKISVYSFPQLHNLHNLGPYRKILVLEHSQRSNV